MSKVILHDTLEPHIDSTGTRLNSLRAAVLGANDGIVSVAGLVVGVAGATTSKSIIFTSGIAGLTAGALSMAVGEYISVSSQRDTERAMLQKERQELVDFPETEFAELTNLYQAKGLTKKTAQQVARELTNKDSFIAHSEAELGLHPDELTNPTHAAIASALAFLCGALVPLVVILLSPQSFRVPFTFISVLAALAATGAISAKTGGSKKSHAIVRMVIGGALAMTVTFGVGKLFGASVG